MATQLISPTARGVERGSFLRALKALAPSERLAIYRSGGLTPVECMLWAANFPDEVPTVNGEFEWIALGMADLD
jgi:hypothetical protein